MRSLRAVVLAGGRGRRLEDLVERLTGERLPKQYCAFGGRPTLLEQTLRRLAPLVPPGDTVVVVQQAHLALARRHLRAHPGVEVLAQPCDRGTAAGVLLPAAHLAREDPAALVVVTPSDHGIRSGAEFRRGIAAARAAIEEGAARVVLLGVEAGEPRTDYGWITPGGTLRAGLRQVGAFVEKPAPEEARELLAAGAVWNTMVLVAEAGALLSLFRRRRPGLAALFEALPALPEEQQAVHLRRAYAAMESCDFSRDILAGSEGLVVCRWRRRLGWTDLGTPERLLAWLGPRTPVEA